MRVAPSSIFFSVCSYCYPSACPSLLLPCLPLLGSLYIYCNSSCFPLSIFLCLLCQKRPVLRLQLASCFFYSIFNRRSDHDTVKQSYARTHAHTYSYTGTTGKHAHNHVAQITFLVPAFFLTFSFSISYPFNQAMQPQLVDDANCRAGF